MYGSRERSELSANVSCRTDRPTPLWGMLPRIPPLNEELVKLIIFGLSISSSWGNGHATLWRGLCRALIERGHRIVFFERDVPYYAAHRDLYEIPGGELVLYSEWEDVLPVARRHLASADVGMVTSYCPDGIAA